MPPIQAEQILGWLARSAKKVPAAVARIVSTAVLDLVRDGRRRVLQKQSQKHNHSTDNTLVQYRDKHWRYSRDQTLADLASGLSREKRSK